eukprot:2912239-Alexandrium_andersonii.AAC.1
MAPTLASKLRRGQRRRRVGTGASPSRISGSHSSMAAQPAVGRLRAEHLRVGECSSFELRARMQVLQSRSSLPSKLKCFECGCLF